MSESPALIYIVVFVFARWLLIRYFRIAKAYAKEEGVRLAAAGKGKKENGGNAKGKYGKVVGDGDRKKVGTNEESDVEKQALLEKAK